MSEKFQRGKTIVTLIVGINLLLNGASIWFTRTMILRWVGELAQSLPDPTVQTSAHALQVWFVMNQRNFTANQGINFAIVTLLCLLLYLGYNWLRWLWGIHWLTIGIVGSLLTIAGLVQLAAFNRLLALGLTVSVIYLICGVLILFAPSVRAYMRVMRRPTTHARRI